MAERALSTLLNELDGVSEGGVEGWGVFLLCCTNRPDLIDAALLRPGRLEHLLMVGFPEEEERRQVLEVHTQRFKLEARGAQAGGRGRPPPPVLERLAARTERFSCAALAALCREAALTALTRSAPKFRGPSVRHRTPKVRRRLTHKRLTHPCPCPFPPSYPPPPNPTSNPTSAPTSTPTSNPSPYHPPQPPPPRPPPSHPQIRTPQRSGKGDATSGGDPLCVDDAGFRFEAPSYSGDVDAFPFEFPNASLLSEGGVSKGGLGEASSCTDLSSDGESEVSQDEDVSAEGVAAEGGVSGGVSWGCSGEGDSSLDAPTVCAADFEAAFALVSATQVLPIEAHSQMLRRFESFGDRHYTPGQ